MNITRSILIALIILLSGCGNNAKTRPDRSEESENLITSAERLRIHENDGSTTIRIINPWQGAGNVIMEWTLVKRNSAIPEGLDSADVIFVPLKKIICMSTTHVAMISALGEENTISGVSGSGFIFSEKLNERISEGLIRDVGYETSLNQELILTISPDLIMMYGIGSESAGYMGKVRELGIKVLVNADYLETDPIRKAEWIKLFGALYCKEKLADSIFRAETQEYTSISNYISENVRNKPDVLLGLPYKDTWYISPGNSFMSKMISDAGGNYLWSETESEISMPFGIENVYLRAMSADYWINIGSANSKSDISSIDQRLIDLPCFENGKLFNNVNRVSAGGGNDYWESGSVFPHIILKDIAAILHPGLFPGHELFFYRKLE